MFDRLLVLFFFTVSRLFYVTGLNPAWPNQSPRPLRTHTNF